MRMDKPIGFMLLFWPCAFGVFLITKDIDYLLLLNFFVGAVLMRSAGCIINDIFDRDYDSKVERTKDRPIASGRVSLSEALFLLAIILILAFLILINLAFNSIIFTIISIPLVILYPLMKRITYFPQFFLGLTFNYGSLVSGVEIQHGLSVEIIILYIACIFWTLGYDSIYGFMDIKDDKKVNVKSLSILIESNPKLWLAFFYGLFYWLFVLSLFLAGKDFTALRLCLMLIAAIHLLWQIFTLDIKSSKNCLLRFKSNNWLGLLVAMAIL